MHASGNRLAFLLATGLLGSAALFPTRSDAADKPVPARKALASARPVAAPAPRSALLTSEAWQNTPRTPVRAGEIDRLVAQ